MKRYLFAIVISLASFSALVGQSKYSGIYSGTVTGNEYIDYQKILAAATSGGRIIAIGDYSYGLYETLDPARSIVSSEGKVVAATPSGISMSATVNSKFQISGTLKQAGMTTRFNGKRIYK